MSVIFNIIYSLFPEEYTHIQSLTSLWSHLSLLKFRHNSFIAKEQPSSNQNKHAGATKKHASQWKCSLLIKIHNSIQRFKCNGFINSFNDLFGEWINQTVWSISIGSWIDHKERICEVVGNNFDEITTYWKVGAVWGDYYSEKVLWR